MTSDVRLSDDESDSETDKNDDDNNNSKLQQQVCIGWYKTLSVAVSVIVGGCDIDFC